MKNLKDVVTSICGLLIVLSGSVVTMEKAGVALPSSVTTAATVIGIVAVALIGYYSGKNPDGSVKSDEQTTQQNSQAKP